MIKLQKIDSKNIWKIVRLNVDDTQTTFVATNTESILEAFANHNEQRIALPFGIYNDDILIGFAMFGYGSIGDAEEPSIVDNNYCLWRLMIDKSFQGQGLGKQVLRCCLDYVRTYPCGKADYCWLSYEPENIGAKALYHNAGFVETGEVCMGEIIAAIKL